MKKILSLLIILGMAVTAIAIPNIADAATTDTFNITVTCVFIEITLELAVKGGAAYDTWACGTLAVSGVDTMAQAEGVFVELGTTSNTVKLQNHVSDEGASWTVGASGADTYEIKSKGFSTTQGSPDASSGTALTTSTADISGSDSIASNADHWVYYQFTAPSSTSTGAEQTIVVTITVVAI